MLRLPDHVTVYGKEQWSFAGTESWQNDFAGLRLRLREEKVQVCATAWNSALWYIRLRWNFDAAEQRKDSVKVLGDAWERGYGNLEWRGIVPERTMPWYCAVSNGSDLQKDHTGRRTDCFGVQVQAGAFCFWQYDRKGVTLWLDLRNGAGGVEPAGRWIDACTVCMETYRDCSAFAALQSFCHVMSPSPLTADHVIYGSNNWYYAYGKSSREEILQDCAFVRAQTQDLSNPPYMVIDDGWQQNDCDAPWEPNEKFGDMQTLCAQMKARGVRPGIWVRYLINGTDNTDYPMPEIPQEWRLQRNDHVLDPSHPAVLDYVRTVTRRIADWGYELIKHDYSTYDLFGSWGFQMQTTVANGDWHFYDRTRTSAEIVVDFYRAIHQAAPNVILIGCNTVSHLCAGLVHANRTGDDTSGREWERTRKMGVNTLAFRLVQDGAFYKADADCVGIMGPVPWSLNSRWLRLLSRSGTPLFVSAKPGLLAPSELDDLRRGFAAGSVQSEHLRPLDWMETTAPTLWQSETAAEEFCWEEEDGNRAFRP